MRALLKSHNVPLSHSECLPERKVVAALGSSSKVLFQRGSKLSTAYAKFRRRSVGHRVKMCVFLILICICLLSNDAYFREIYRGIRAVNTNKTLSTWEQVRHQLCLNDFGHAHSGKACCNSNDNFSRCPSGHQMYQRVSVCHVHKKWFTEA
jgi:hypothetical protein